MKYLSSIISAFCCFLVVVCMLRIGSLKNELDSMRNNTGYQIDRLQDYVLSVRGDMFKALEEGASLLSSHGYVLNGYDAENLTANITCRVVPKEYNPQQTVATLVADGVEYPMILENGAYIADIALPLFKENTISHVVLEQNENVRTQQLDEYIHPQSQLLPEIYSYSGPANVRNIENDICTVTYNGELDFDFIHRGLEYSKDNFEVVVTVNNKEVDRKEVKYIDERYRDDGHVFSGIIVLDGAYSLNKGETLKMYICYTDNNGWEYRTCCDKLGFSLKGELEHQDAYEYGYEIFGADGKPLYTQDIK